MALEHVGDGLPEQAEDRGEQILTEWKFRGRPPTEEQVRSLLGTLPPVYGVQHADYFDFVQALPASEKVLTPHPDPTKDTLVEEYVDVWTIYMSVAGRQAMLNAAQQLNGWTVLVEPEPSVAPPGYLEFADKLVYRVAVRIFMPPAPPGESFNNPSPFNQDSLGRLLGVRHGTAWVPAPGDRKQAARSNPYEKVETSALGRALGGWGFGVFPGSGIASVDEMQQIKENRAYLEAVKTGQAPPAKRSRQDLLQEVAAVNEQLMQALNLTQEQADRAIGAYLTSRLQVPAAFDEQTAIIDWERLRDGQLDILLNALKNRLRQALAKIDDPLGGA